MQRKMGDYSRHFCKGKIARKRDLGGGEGAVNALVWRLFQLKPGAGIRGSVQTVTVLHGFLPSALNLNRLGLIYLFTLGRRAH